MIEENLLTIYKAKYFVKLGGRVIRGNAVIEAISLGTLVIMNPHDILYHRLLPPETQCKNAEEIINLINYLDQDEDEYQRLLNLQKSLVDNYIYKNLYKV